MIEEELTVRRKTLLVSQTLVSSSCKVWNLNKFLGQFSQLNPIKFTSLDEGFKGLFLVILRSNIPELVGTNWRFNLMEHGPSRLELLDLNLIFLDLASEGMWSQT